MKTKPENFILSAEFLQSISMDEISATFDAMVECDLDRAPYEEFYITVPEAAIIKVTGGAPEPDTIHPDAIMEFHFIGLNGSLRNGTSGAMPNARVKVLSWHGKKPSLDWFKVLPKALPDRPELVIDIADKLAGCGAALVEILVVSLATRAIQKTRLANKLARLGIGKGRTARHGYTTTISAPAPNSLETESGHGGTVRPHLRRGHVRTQPYGPNNELRKKIFIEAVFVNSDKDFVSFRDHYNISFKPGAQIQ